MTTLLNTLESKQGELFAIGQGRRIIFAHCRPKIEIYEDAVQVPVLGELKGEKKSLRFVIALCGDMNFTHSNVDECIQKAERYELTADLMRNNGIVERFYFHNISLDEIKANGEWEFTLHVTKEQMDKLLVMAGIF